MPSSPSHSPASAISVHSTAVSAGHGESTASAGAKKNPVPMYQDEPARSDFNTKRSQPGIPLPSNCFPDALMSSRSSSDPHSAITPDVRTDPQ